LLIGILSSCKKKLENFWQSWRENPDQDIPQNVTHNVCKLQNVIGLVAIPLELKSTQWIIKTASQHIKDIEKSIRYEGQVVSNVICTVYVNNFFYKYCIYTLFLTGPCKCPISMDWIYVSYHESNMCCWSEILWSLSENFMHLIQLYYRLIFALKLIIDKILIY
jgi:hypothetical protein